MRESNTPLALIPLLVLVLLIPAAASAADASPCESGLSFTLPNGDTGCSHGDDTPPPPLPPTYARELTLAADAAAGTIRCTGDGLKGNRVQALYLVAEDQTNRASEVVPQIRAWAAEIDEMVQRSAAAFDTDLALRWVHDASCKLDVQTVIVPADGDDNFANTIDALADLGFTDPSRHYLAWTDAPTYCGLAVNYIDDRASDNNFNNGGNSLYARVDRGCWGGVVALHELTHMLGGVQQSAPNATSYGHCTDEYDIMCYPDGPDSAMEITCEDRSRDVLWDCGGDDYFNPEPAVGSYLSTHWNLANSSFIANQGTASEPADPIEPQVPREPAASFVDVTADNPFVSDIEWLATSGITRGCNPPANDRFCPFDGVSRGQMAAFLNRAIDEDLPLGEGFSDTTGSVFDEDVRRLAGGGITRGCGPDRFCPDETVTRGQMAAFMVRAFQLPETASDFFSDDNGSVFEADINRMAAAGLTTGCSSTSFCPNDRITRGQMAAFLHRAID